MCEWEAGICNKYNQNPSLFLHPTQSSLRASGKKNPTLGFVPQASACQEGLSGASFLEAPAALAAGTGGPYVGLAERDRVNSPRNDLQTMREKNK